jgi:dynein light chain LC8-type
MPSEMQEYAISTALRTLNKYNDEYKIATFIKREFDKKCGQTWHCIVGHNFDSCASRENKHFFFISVLEEWLFFYTKLKNFFLISFRNQFRKSNEEKTKFSKI